MTTGELLAALRRNLVLIVSVLALSVIAAVATLQLRSPVYESAATIALIPTTSTETIGVLGNAEVLSSFYATAARSEVVRSAASMRLGEPLAQISVQSFHSPIVKIRATSNDARLAQRTVQVVAESLVATNAAGEIGMPNIRPVVIDPPSNGSKVSPSARLTLAAAVVAGLVLSGAAALVRENRRTATKESEEVAESIGVPILGRFPRARALQRELPTPQQCLTSTEFRGLVAAARELRTNLRLVSDYPGFIAVTSPSGNHGKTTVALALSAVLARKDAPTLLVDADFGAHRLSRRFDISELPGFSELLTGTRSLESVIADTDLEGLSLMGTGLNRSASELLDRATSLVPLRKAVAGFHAVVFDCSSVGDFDDARLIAAQSGTRLLVVRAGGADVNDIHIAIESLSLVDAPPTGVVMTFARAAGRNGQ